MKNFIACRNDYTGMCERAQWCKANFGKSSAYQSCVSSITRWHILHINENIRGHFHYVFSFFNDNDATLFQLTWC